VVTLGDDRRGSGAGSDPGPFVRPYTITGAAGGRIRSWHADLGLEALVVTSLLGEMATNLGFERRSIVRLCRDVQSIAEISVRLQLPLGVTRALVGDLADEGLVAVYGSAQAADPPDLALLQRVLDGLHRI
jgi:Protein of unknown function (DUF742)